MSLVTEVYVLEAVSVRKVSVLGAVSVRKASVLGAISQVELVAVQKNNGVLLLQNVNLASFILIWGELREHGGGIARCVCVFGIPYSFKLNPYKISQQSTWSNLCAKDLERKKVGTIQHSLNYKTLNRRHVSEFDSVIRLINVLVNLQPQML